MVQFCLQFILLALIATGVLATPNSPSTLPPHLSQLYFKYPQMHAVFEKYAKAQGFQGEREQLAVIVHELIHVDSAAQGAYVIDGVGYDPYNRPSEWPNYSFVQFAESIYRSRISTLPAIADTPVFRLYVRNAPNNTLANLADELNAYGQTSDWLCRNTSLSEQVRTVQSLRDMLRVTNAYLLKLKENRIDQYHAFYHQQKPARNLLALTIINALRSLNTCRSPLGLLEQDELNRLTHTAMREAGTL